MAPASPSLAELAAAAYDRLTPAERKVADAVVSDPELIGFGTVASIADRAGSSGATVVRLAAKLGFDGFSGMQVAAQRDLRLRLRPATERIREPPDRDVVARVLRSGLDAVHGTLGAIDGPTFDAIVAALSDRRHRLWIVSGDAGFGVASMLSTQLSMLRTGVEQVNGNPMQVARRLADVERRDVVVALDLRRYDRWVLEWVGAASGSGATVAALTDSSVSPLARASVWSIVLQAEGAGPFDTYLGAMALVEALVAGVAGQLRTSATRSLDRIEEAWRAGGLLEE